MVPGSSFVTRQRALKHETTLDASSPSLSRPFIPQYTFRSKIGDTRVPPLSDSGPSSPPGSSTTSGGAAAAEGASIGAGGEGNMAIFSAGGDDRLKSKGRWRMSMDRDVSFNGRLHGESKRRRNSSWFRRLTSSFQLNRTRSPSEEVPQEQALSAPPTVADGRSGDLSVQATTSTVTASTARSLFTVDGVAEGDTPRSGGGASSAHSYMTACAEPGVPGTVVAGADVGSAKLVTETRRETVWQGDPEVVTAENGAASMESDEEESDCETGSNTTEGFGSDDAGDLWDGGRATGLLDHSPVKASDDSQKYRPIGVRDSGGHAGGGGGKGGDGASTPAGAAGEVVPETARAQAGEEVKVAKAPRNPETAESGGVLRALDSEKPVAATPKLGGGNPPSGCGSLTHVGDTFVDEGDGRKEGGHINDHRVAGCDNEVDASLECGSPELLSPKLPRFAAVATRSTEPPSALPASPQAAPASPQPAVSAEQVMPPPRPKLQSSPSLSETSSSRESPRAWRLSWWARASDRHRPPPPYAGSGDDEDVGAAASSLAATLAAAAAGGEEATAALSAGGSFSPTVNGGDAPAVVDGGTGEKLVGSHGEDVITKGDTASSEAAAVKPTAAAEKRTSRRSRRRGKLYKRWLAVDKLTDAQVRPLEAASDYLDVTGLARACGVCRAWSERLGGESGARQWMRCVRQARGVPEEWRASLYLHILYEKPSWVTKVT